MEKEVKEEKEKGGFVKGLFKLIYNLILWAIGLFLVFEVVMGVLNMQKLNNDEEPLWYFDSKVEQKEEVKVTTYNLGLYVITKEEGPRARKINLKPFFIK